MENSPQGTIFSEPVYLSLVGRPVDRYVVQQGNQVKAGFCVVPTPDGLGCELDDLIIHNGIMFLHDGSKKAVRRRFEQFEIASFVIAELDRRYRTIEIALAPRFDDLRPFLWHNYHDPDPARRFAVDLRYTTVLDISDLAESRSGGESPSFRRMETLRQRHVREAWKSGASIRAVGESECLVGYYRRLMLRQEVPPDEAKLSRMRKLLDGLAEVGRGCIHETVNAEGAVVYVVAYAWDRKRAYYLFGAGHPETSEPWQGTFAHWGSFESLARRGIGEVDLEGVNSPQRGWFKMGFGGELLPYFQLYKRAPEPNGPVAHLPLE